jgi:hypothetical protein
MIDKSPTKRLGESNEVAEMTGPTRPASPPAAHFLRAASYRALFSAFGG